MTIVSALSEVEARKYSYAGLPCAPLERSLDLRGLFICTKVQRHRVVDQEFGLTTTPAVVVVGRVVPVRGLHQLPVNRSQLRQVVIMVGQSADRVPVGEGDRKAGGRYLLNRADQVGNAGLAIGVASDIAALDREQH